MDVNSFKTKSTNPSEVERAWYVVDAADKVVGRLASRIAHILRGKHKPSFTPHVDTGDYVIVVNADQARFTGRKETEKAYFRYSGYPGGDRTRAPESLREKQPTFIIENAIKGMLPNGPLGRQMFKKLKTYTGPEHPHQAQQPHALSL